jgi:hypothetical protein
VGLNEDALCRLFAEKIRNSAEFRSWVLDQTKFGGHSDAILLHEEQAKSRPSVRADNWWRHWWCRIPSSGKEGETDIFLAFEAPRAKSRFALHIENKMAAEFLDGQPEGYEARARYKMSDPKWLNYIDFETILIAPREYREARRQSCDVFNRFISYESIATFIPEFLLDLRHARAASPQVVPDSKQSLSPQPVASIPWKQDLEWKAAIERVSRYYFLRKNLKIGSKRSFLIIDFLCERMSVTQDELLERFSLSKDDIAAILANVTMAIQRAGSVWSPASGGWYTTVPNPHTYIVAPGHHQELRCCVIRQLEDSNADLRPTHQVAHVGLGKRKSRA